MEPQSITPASAAGLARPISATGLAAAGDDGAAAFAALAEAGGLIAWTMRADGGTEGMAAWGTYTGQSERELADGGWLNALHTGDRDRVARAWRAATVAGGSFEQECRIRRHDGLYQAFTLRGVPIRSLGETPQAWAIACARTSGRDATRREGRAEERRRARAGAARGMEARGTEARDAAELARQLEAVVETMADGVAVLDREGALIYANPAVRAIFALDQEPGFSALPVAERWRRMAARDERGEPLPQELWPPNRVLRGEVLAGASVAEVTLRALDGHDVPLSMSGAPVRDAAGAIVGGVVVARDVTERRRLERLAEAAAAEAEARARELAAIIESMADGVIVFDRDGRILHTNATDAAMFGGHDPVGAARTLEQRDSWFAYLDEEGKPFPDERRPTERVLRGEVLRGDSAADLVMRAQDGQETVVNASGAPILASDGSVIGGVLIGRDVTERRREERRTREALAALLAMAETLVAGHPDAVDEGDATLAMVARRLANLTATVLSCERVTIVPLGPSDEVLATVAATGPMPDEERRGYQSRWPGERHLGDFLSPAIINRLHAGEPVPLDRSTPPIDRWPNPLGWRSVLIVPMMLGHQLVGTVTLDFGREAHVAAPDELALAGGVARLAALVLERERLLREREEARGSALALREANRRMDEFLGIAAHELKTPVTSGILNVGLATLRLQTLRDNLLARAGGVATGAAELVGEQLDAMVGLMAAAEDSIERLSRLVADLLDVSRIRAGRLEFRPEPCDLAAIVREAVDEQRQIAPARAIRLEHGGMAAIPIVADGDRIRQVVTNYLTNALKYSPEDQPVRVRVAAREGLARVSVRDEGPGLPAEERLRVWDRYHRAPDIQANPGAGMGLGLGLHICRTIIERHQGQVGVRSAPGRGSTFWFALPVG
ncbi:MAG TPA: PAS domain S-box protein [Ktedonobacterales bacterium]